MMRMSDAEIEALALSLQIALRSVLCSLPLAIFVAWLLARRRFAGRTLLDAFVHLPMVLPPVMIGYVLLLLFGVRGPIGHWLHEHLGLQLAFTTAGGRRRTPSTCASRRGSPPSISSSPPAPVRPRSNSRTTRAPLP